MKHILGALPFALPYVMIVFVVVASHEGGWVISIPFWIWLTMGDFAFGLRTTNLDPSTPERELWAYSLSLWLWVPCQLGGTVYVFWQILISGHLSMVENIALAFVLGKVNAHTIVAGHELIHRTAKWERGLGQIMLGSIAFVYYQTEHVLIHHRHVGTPTDTVFAAKGNRSGAISRGVCSGACSCPGVSNATGSLGLAFPFGIGAIRSGITTY